jgi:hypothetical protein
MSTTTCEQWRDAATSLHETELEKRLIATAQTNPWLKVGGVDFEDDLCMEHDYTWFLQEYTDPDMLAAFFEHGNWAIRAAVKYKDLIFVNQVNGGDEWWTVKICPDGTLLPFESISVARMIEHGTWADCLQRMSTATSAQCRALGY